MANQLPVELADLKLLLGISDTTQDTALTALVALEQPVLEYALDPAILAFATGTDGGGGIPGLAATLVLGCEECLAGSYLATAGRNPEQLPTQVLFKVATTEISQKLLALPTALGAQLAAVGLARLKPFSRSARALARAANPNDASIDDMADVPLLLGSGMGNAGSQPLTGGAQGPPPDSVFDRALGRDGRTEPPGGDVLSPPFISWFGPGGEP